MAPSTTKTLASGALSYFLGYLGKLAGPVFLALASRFYGEELVGVYLSALVLLETATRLTAGGLSEGASLTMVRHFKERGGRYEVPEQAYRYLANAFHLGMFLSLIGALALGAGLPWIQERGWTRFTPDTVAALQILCWGLPLQFLTQISVSSTRALLKAKYDVLINSFLRELGPLVFALLLLLFPEAPARLAWAQLLSYALSAMVGLLIMRRYYSLRGLLRWRPLDWSFLAFCLPLTLNDLFLGLIQDLDLIMLASSGAASKLELAFYGVAVHMVFTMRMFRLNFMRMLGPMASRLYVQERHEELAQASRTTVRWILYLVLPFLGALILARRPVLAFYSPEYLPYADCLLILAIGPLVNAVFGINASLLVALGRPMLNLVNNGITVAVNLALNLYLIPRFGIYGAASATAASMTFAQVLAALQTRRYVQRMWRWRTFRKPLVAFALAFVPLAAARYWVEGLVPQLLLAALFCAAFFLLVAAQGLDKEDAEGFPWLAGLSARIRAWLPSGILPKGP